ncbi:sfmM2 [Symbiodinium natans]|uniref:SfmM2 protein n=1 Tax=Symbiodinium natans TaxID=878477 RepID=A0A812J006_9DINO|nr:sfmM2 [Symbiodinium natans]
MVVWGYPVLEEFPIQVLAVVIWSKKVLLQIFKKAFDALTPGGGLVVFNSFANDDMDGPEWAGLDSVYFQAVPVTSGGYIWSMAQVEGFLREVGCEAAFLWRSAEKETIRMKRNSVLILTMTMSSRVFTREAAVKPAYRQASAQTALLMSLVQPREYYQVQPDLCGASLSAPSIDEEFTST